jgi:hypothetical protein
MYRLVSILYELRDFKIYPLQTEDLTIQFERDFLFVQPWSNGIQFIFLQAHPKARHCPKREDMLVTDSLFVVFRSSLPAVAYFKLIVGHLPFFKMNR